jgi:K+ transporter
MSLEQAIFGLFSVIIWTALWLIFFRYILKNKK